MNNAWNIFQLLLLFAMGLVFLVVLVLYALSYWRETRNKGGREVRVQRSRGPSVIIGRWGPMYARDYTKYSETEFNIVMVDRWGRKHHENIKAHELRPANILQCAFGPGNPVFYHVPGQDAQQIAEQTYHEMKDTGVLHEYKRTAEQATAAAKLANTRVDAKAKEIIEKAAMMEKAKQPVMAQQRR